MPKTVHGNAKYRSALDLARKNYDYDYPEGIDLKPGSRLHERIVREVLERADDSHSVMSSRFSSWNKIDEVLTTYVDLTESEKELKQQDQSKPVSIVFPYSYAILETLLTYAMNALVQDPIFQYKGFSSKDTTGAILLQKKIQQDCIKHKVALSLHTFMRDCLAYGSGYAVPGWHERYGTRYRQATDGVLGPDGRIMAKTQQVVQDYQLLYEGNKLENIDPYMVLPDPHVSVHKIQDGDFFGWIEETSVMKLLDDEQQNADYVNCKYVKDMGEATSHITNASNRDLATTRGGEISPGVRMPADVIWMYINLIPADWELGDSEYPEKWFFGVAGDMIVIQAKPSKLNHGMYPVAAGSPDFDGYSIAPISRLETLYGLQHVIDFEFNSHVENVRKCINDMLVVDPFLINMNDLKTPKAGKLIRMRRPGWGKGVKDAVHQLAVNDITQNNISDVNFLTNYMNHTSGVDEAMMGSLRQGGPERLTGQEFSGTRSSAMSRLERMAMVLSLQAMQDIGYFFATHTQQLMSQETYVSTAGEWEETLKAIYGQRDQVPVSPYDLAIDWDIVVRDGSTPTNQDAAAWRTLFADMLKVPEVYQHFDIVKIFKHVAHTMGARNVEEFVRVANNANVSVRSDEDVARQAEQGNLVPTDQL